MNETEKEMVELAPQISFELGPCNYTISDCAVWDYSWWFNNSIINVTEVTEPGNYTCITSYLGCEHDVKTVEIVRVFPTGRSGLDLHYIDSNCSCVVV